MTINNSFDSAKMINSFDSAKAAAVAASPSSETAETKKEIRNPKKERKSELDKLELSSDALRKVLEETKNEQDGKKIKKLTKTADKKSGGLVISPAELGLKDTKGVTVTGLGFHTGEGKGGVSIEWNGDKISAGKHVVNVYKDCQLIATVKIMLK